MSYNPVKGISLALLATAMWGAMPIAAQKVLSVMDAQTLVWFRFLVAGLGLFFILGMSKKLPKLPNLTDKRRWKLLIFGVIGLSYYFFASSYALNFIEPTTNQVLWQLSPFTMMFCSFLIFKEKFGRYQKIGLVLLVFGLIAFFNQRLVDLIALNQYGLGVVIGASAAIIWVIYGVAQKLLLSHYTAQQVLLLIYCGCTLVFMPFMHIHQTQALSGLVLACFIFCCLNTLIAYGAYAEALNYWDASKVSVITILLPIFTMAFQAIGHLILPDEIAPLTMNLLSYFGALIVIIGTILSTLGDKLCKK